MKTYLDLLDVNESKSWKSFGHPDGHQDVTSARLYERSISLIFTVSLLCKRDDLLPEILENFTLHCSWFAVGITKLGFHCILNGIDHSSELECDGRKVSWSLHDVEKSFRPYTTF